MAECIVAKLLIACITFAVPLLTKWRGLAVCKMLGGSHEDVSRGDWGPGDREVGTDNGEWVRLVLSLVTEERRDSGDWCCRE